MPASDKTKSTFISPTPSWCESKGLTERAYANKIKEMRGEKVILTSDGETGFVSPSASWCESHGMTEAAYDRKMREMDEEREERKAYEEQVILPYPIMFLPVPGKIFG